MKKMSILPAAALTMAAFHGAAGASDAAIAKLAECMKMKAATREQQACLKQVQALRAPVAMKSMSVAAPRTKSATAMPTAAAKVIEPPPEFKAAAATVHLNGAPAAAYGTSIGGIGGGITVGDIKGLDLETAMMAIQSQRANLLEGQLRTQLDSISARNEEIARLHKLVADLAALQPSGLHEWGNLGANTAEGRTNLARLRAAGLVIPADVDEPGTGIYDARGATYKHWIEGIRGKIDGLNSSQQMDMLRMQSLTNKRNEAFDLMTNFIKKMADSRSSVLGNMR